MINMMDRWLKDHALLSRKYFPDVNESLSGAGAAGGLGFAFLTFLHATLESGIKIVLEEIQSFATMFKMPTLVVLVEAASMGRLSWERRLSVSQKLQGIWCLQLPFPAVSQRCHRLQ